MSKKSTLSEISSQNIKYLALLLKIKEHMYIVCEDDKHAKTLKQENKELEHHIKLNISYHIQVFKNTDFSN